MSDAIFPKQDRSALLVVDVQDRLMGAMDPDAVQALVRQNLLLVELAGEIGWDIIYSEQYPKGLGATNATLLEALQRHNAVRLEKVEFSCCRNQTFLDTLLPQLPSHVIVSGMEAHVCVLQTVSDLQSRGHQCFVPGDAVLSRTAANTENGLRLMRQVGAVHTNAESLVFYALQRAGTDVFKKFSKMLR